MSAVKRVVRDELNEISRLASEAERFNDFFNEEIKSFKNTVERSNQRETKLKQRIDDELKFKMNAEKEAHELTQNIKDVYERNMKKLRSHQEKQLTMVAERNRDEVKKWKDRYNSLRAEQTMNKTMNIDSEEVVKEKLELQEQIKTLEKNVDRLKENNLKLAAEVSEAHQEKKELQKEFREFKTSLTFDKKEVSSKDAELTRMKRKLEDLKHEISSQKDRYEQLKREKDEDVQNWKEKFQSIKKNYDNLKTEKHAPSPDNSFSSNKDVNFMKDEHKIATIEIHSLKRKLDTKEGLCDALRVTIQRNEKLIDELEERYSDEKEKVSKLKHEIEINKAEIDEKKEEIDDKNIEIKRLKSELEDKRRRVGDDSKNLETLRENEKKWKSKATRMEERVEKLMKEIEEIKRSNASLNIGQTRKQTELENVQLENKKLQKLNREMKKLIESLELELETYHEKITDFASAKNSLVKEKGSISCEVGTLKSNLQKAQQEIKNLIDIRDEIASTLSVKELEFQDTLEHQKYEIDYLKERLEEEKLHAVKLEENISEYEQSDNNAENLREALRVIKEEASNYITKIQNLEGENHHLNTKYAAAKEKEKELRGRIQVANDKIRELTRNLENAKKIAEEKEKQQVKLMEHLKEQTEAAEKKKKPYLVFNSKLVGEEGSKTLQAEQDKNRRLNDEIQSLRRDYEFSLEEVQKLKSRIFELRNGRHLSDLDPEVSNSFYHNFDIIKIESTYSPMCVVCAKKIHKSAQKCRDCGAVIHVGCNMLPNCGVKPDAYRNTYTLNGGNISPHDGASSDSGSSRNSMFRPSAPASVSESDSCDEVRCLEEKIQKMQREFLRENNISPSKRRPSKPLKTKRYNLE